MPEKPHVDDGPVLGAVFKDSDNTSPQMDESQLRTRQEGFKGSMQVNAGSHPENGKPGCLVGSVTEASNS